MAPTLTKSWKSWLPVSSIAALILWVAACGGTAEPASSNLPDSPANQPQEEPQAHGTEPTGEDEPGLLAAADGDLDKDGAYEKVRVVKTGGQGDWGEVRELQIMKMENDRWEIWHSSRDCIRKSEEGGMMGDPFDGIEIKNGILIIHHWGGSRWKWSTTDKYRFQNDRFELIGFTSAYGAPCEHYETLDYNLSTGMAEATKVWESCDSDEPEIVEEQEETFPAGRADVHIGNRYLQERTVTSPEYEMMFSW